MIRKTNHFLRKRKRISSDLFLGDGCFMERRNRVTFTFNNFKDERIVEKLKSILSRLSVNFVEYVYEGSRRIEVFF